MRILISSLVLIAAIGLYINYGGVNSSVAEAEQSEALAQIEIPSELSGLATIGKRGFHKNCAACHGENAILPYDVFSMTCQLGPQYFSEYFCQQLT